MIRKYLLTKRSGLLPWVKDWTDDQDEIRFAKDVKKLSYEQWFWCHPSAYKLIQYGIYLIGLCVYLIAWKVLYNYGVYWVAYINFILAIIMVYMLYKKHQEMKYIPYLTFYDLYLRDYEVNKNEK